MSTEGSWEAGVDGAKPGIVMKSNPQVGDTYRQEFLKGEAEDMGQVLSIDESVSIGWEVMKIVSRLRIGRLLSLKLSNTNFIVEKLETSYWNRKLPASPDKSRSLR